MKKLVLILLLVIWYLVPNLSNAQTIYKLDSTYHEQTRTTCDAILYDNGGSFNNYDTSINYWTAFCPATPNSRISLRFDQFDIDPSDKIEIFSGVGLNGAIHSTAGNTPFFTNNDLLGQTIMAYVSEPSGCLTVHIISDGANTASGFKAIVECVAYCQYPIAALDTYFNKISPDGTKTPFQIRNCTDTSYIDSVRYNLIHYKAIDICENDSIELVAKPVFPDSAYGYPQDISTCIFSWNYGDMSYDTILFDNHASHKWDEVRGYDLGLTILDTLHGGCRSRNPIDARVRIAKNPIKTVSPIPDMCSGQVFTFNVGYEGNNTIKIDSILFERGATQKFDSAVFIPDGPDCPTPCYESPVTFTEFMPGAVINSVDDILSICINMEHSFIGDLSIEVVCPNGTSAVLKHFTHSGGAFLGQALDQSSGCDPNNSSNTVGVCWTYCFSNQFLNGQRGVINGNNMGSPIDSTHIVDSTGYFQTPNQSATSMATGWETTDLNGFSNLIGCPLNGEWKIRVCDYWGADNGWVCWWDMSLSQGSMADWEYQVPIDTVMIDGPFIVGKSDTSLLFAPPIDSCGSYNYDVHIIDDFLCVWDTVTKLEVVCTPQVDLGDDIQICEQLETVLDAGNPGASEYLWEPTGEKTQTIQITTPPNANDVLTYIAEVTNTNGMISCYGQDTILIEVRPAGLAAFHTDPLILEGCEPFNFQLISNSTNADSIEWTVGQLKSSIPNPTFSFPYGTYDVKLKVRTQYGCVDSIVQPQMIHVYKSPTADFGWQPTNPSSTNPTVNFLNQTTPYDVTNQYLWKIQAAKTSPLRENIFGLEPSYTWRPYPGANVVGDYLITLDAYTVNNGPSGILYECHDTITKVISIINDSLMFPSLVSPNGDGINDVFIIRNLVDGQAFPDNELVIYNRNGKRIFYIQDVRSDDEAWDPNKTSSPAGTYFYKFVGRGPTKNVEFNGSIEVMR